MATDRTGLRQTSSRVTPNGAPPGPVRTCVGCRQSDSRSALLRVVAVTDDEGLAHVTPDPRRRLPGRGAWLHPVSGCFDLAVRRRAFGRALRVSAPVDPTPVAAYLEAGSQIPSTVSTESRF